MQEFPLKYASVDLAIQAIIGIGPGAELSKTDISDAFKLPIAPSLSQWHGIKLTEYYYFATKLTFGSKSSLWLFDVFAQALAWILSHQAHCQTFIHYLFDFLHIKQSGTPSADLDKLRIVFSNFNVPIADHKVEGPTHYHLPRCHSSLY